MSIRSKYGQINYVRRVFCLKLIMSRGTFQKLIVSDVVHIEIIVCLSGWSRKLEPPCLGNKICLNGVLTKFNDVWTQ